MEWVLLILIIAFSIWSVQILTVYRRQEQRMDAQARLAQTNQLEIITKAEEYEIRVAELNGELEELKKQLDGLERTEMGLEKEVEQLKLNEMQRRPTSFRVDTDPKDE